MIEWDFELNDIEPSKISPNSSKKQIGFAQKNHLYKASITKRKSWTEMVIIAIAHGLAG